MKIAALSPQFVVESPTAAESSEAKRTHHKLGVLRLVQTEGASSASADGGDSTGPGYERKEGEEEEDLEKETREGIKRLSRLIQRHARSQTAQAPPEQRKGGPSFDGEFKKRKAISAYQELAAFKDPLNSKGIQIDLLY